MVDLIFQSSEKICCVKTFLLLSEPPRDSDCKLQSCCFPLKRPSRGGIFSSLVCTGLDQSVWKLKPVYQLLFFTIGSRTYNTNFSIISPSHKYGSWVKYSGIPSSFLDFSAHIVTCSVCRCWVTLPYTNRWYIPATSSLTLSFDLDMIRPRTLFSKWRPFFLFLMKKLLWLWRLKTESITRQQCVGVFFCFFPLFSHFMYTGLSLWLLWIIKMAHKGAAIQKHNKQSAHEMCIVSRVSRPSCWDRCFTVNVLFSWLLEQQTFITVSLQSPTDFRGYDPNLRIQLVHAGIQLCQQRG